MATAPQPASAKESQRDGLAQGVPSGFAPRVSLDQDMTQLRLHSTAAPETTVLGAWSFDVGGGCDTEGWVSVDLTAHDVYFHVDDFAGLGGGDFGRLVAPEGSQAMWCGLRPDTLNPEICGYATLPGYGNLWDQRFQTADCVNVQGDVVIDYYLAWDSEPGYDGTRVQVDRCDDKWVNVNPTGYYDYLWGTGSQFFSTPVPDSLHAGSLRIRFYFASDGAWSDQDGLWDTDGALIIDSLTVSDATGTVLPTETFESEAVGDQATLSGNWVGSSGEGFGDYAALYPGIEMLDIDPCVDNLTCMWAFLSGTTADYTCGGYPGVPAIPFGNGQGKYIKNEIWSPMVPNAGAGSTFELAFDVYSDLPLDNLIFFVWHVRSYVGNCPGQWEDSGSFFYDEDRIWKRRVFDASPFVDAGADAFQVALGVVDQCPFWCGSQGTGACHSNAPMFDNPELRRIDTNGPTWSIRPTRLFQDNFASDGTTTGTVRADMAIDVSSHYATTIQPGDSAVVFTRDPERPLATDPFTGTGPAVYAYVSVWPQGQPGKSGAPLSGGSRWPVVDTFSHNGTTWTCVRMDTVRTNFGTLVADQYCVDLSDNLFTPGDTICYVFAATSDGPLGSFSTYYSIFTGTTDDLSYALDNPMEFTCLPTPSPLGGSRILYVDGYDGRGVQPFFDTAFQQLGIADAVDRYDIISLPGKTSNGPAARVKDIFQQVIPVYNTVIWNTGATERFAIASGNTVGSQKQDDFGFLYDFINNLPTAGGIYLSGDHLATDWAQYWTSGQSVVLRSQYINFNVASPSHVDYGLGVSPLVMGMDTGCFDHVTGPDTLVAFGGCPGATTFDVLSATGSSVAQAAYVGGGTAGAAILSQTSINADSMTVGVVLSGFSFDRIRDASPDGVSARAEHLEDILMCLGAMSPVATRVAPAAPRNSLAQNYPNPFNPATTVEFTVRGKAKVALRVYNVRGQLVRTLVDGVRSPGIVHRVEWDGRNDAGQSVASGVYFYRLATEDFTQTRKMVLLK